MVYRRSCSRPLVDVGAGLQGHHDFFERGVAGALADAVDRALDLPRARPAGRQAVGHRQGPGRRGSGPRRWPCSAAGHLLDAGRRSAPVVLDGRRVADRVRHVQVEAPGLERGAEDLHQVVAVGAGRVLGRELDVVAVLRAPGVTARSTSSSTCSRVMRSLCSRWMSLVAMKVWMRGLAAPSSA